MLSLSGCEWREAPSPDSDIQRLIEKNFDVHPLVARLLALKDMDQNSIDSYLHSSLKDMVDPFELDGLKDSADFVCNAILNKKNVIIHGDYDADGITSTAVLHLFLQEVGIKSFPFIPNRLENGHGISLDALEIAKTNNCKLMITCDVGISAVDEIKEFVDSGIEVVITDHHLSGETIPNATAIFNPTTSNEENFKHLSGVGTAFYLLIAIRSQLRESGFFKNCSEPDLKSYLDLVAIGTIADVSPMLGENRVLTKCGLEELSKTGRPGLNALKQVSGLSMSRPLNYMDIAFRIAPRINAAGRLGKADVAFELMITKSFTKAIDFAKKLESYNLERKKIEENVIKEASLLVEACEDLDSKKAFCLSRKNWHRGVIGLVAGRLCEKYSKTFAMVSVDDDVCRGSVRSVEPVNVVEILNACKDLLIAFGGHESAGGFSVKKENLEKFSLKFVELIAKEYDSKKLKRKVITVEGEIDFKEIDDNLMRSLELLEPFGPGNDRPNLLAKTVQIKEVFPFGKTNLRLLLSQGGRETFEAVTFRLNEKKENLMNKSTDILLYPEFNYYGGKKKIRLMIKDIR